MISIRLKVDRERLRQIPFASEIFGDELERRRAYEELFFGSPLGARVLADILRSNGAMAVSFTAHKKFDPIPAAHADGQKHAALSIFQTAGGSQARLARAAIEDDLTEAIDE